MNIGWFKIETILRGRGDTSHIMQNHFSTATCTILHMQWYKKSNEAEKNNIKQDRDEE